MDFDITGGRRSRKGEEREILALSIILSQVFEERVRLRLRRLTREVITWPSKLRKTHVSI